MVGWDDDAFHSQVICIRTPCLPPTTFLFLRLRNDIHFAVVEGTQTNMIFDQNEQQNISFERVAEDITGLVRCTTIQIVYWNIVFPSYLYTTITGGSSSLE